MQCLSNIVNYFVNEMYYVKSCQQFKNKLFFLLFEDSVLDETKKSKKSNFIYSTYLNIIFKISYSIAFSVLRKNLYVIFCCNNGLLTKYMVKVQSWKMSRKLGETRCKSVAEWRQPCSLAVCLSNLPPTMACSETSCCSKLHLGSLFWNIDFRLCHRQKRS